MALASALQIPYRESREGFWGEQTSTLNWCEEDYNITFYCAEAINTLTNLVFMWLGFKGLRNVIAYSHSRVFILAFMGYIVVGLGSMAFHTTLHYEMQLADELPMIYTVCIMAFATFSYRRSAKVKALIAAALVGVATFITVYYLYAKDPVFHQVAYGLLTAATVFSSSYAMERDLKPKLSQRNPAECGRYMREMHRLGLTGILLFLAGFFMWNMDNIYCHDLTITKKQIMLPWSVILEGHGWWHVLTGLAYHLILWRVWLNRCLDGGEKDFVLDWAPLRSIPQVLVREIESQAIAAQQQISLVRTQVASKQREMRLAQLTSSEMASLPSDTPVYEGVGKMYVSPPPYFYFAPLLKENQVNKPLLARFVAVPVPGLQDKLGSQIKEIETEIDGMGKRLHYLETTAKNSQEHIEKMLKGSGQP
ncbi:ceramidase-domain-containing protein [Chaetomidium leptoderma]|uniref:Ceramidase-domain-containing protein n=1 Tax=Chaetomidium leptoderma TaxID=669021 RepID=A0AAN6VK10_9PEZI|nr:ceramidase-domain-containing protein [Chaetomidium leptoderma]